VGIVVSQHSRAGSRAGIGSFFTAGVRHHARTPAKHNHCAERRQFYQNIFHHQLVIINGTA